MDHKEELEELFDLVESLNIRLKKIEEDTRRLDSVIESKVNKDKV